MISGFLWFAPIWVGWQEGPALVRSLAMALSGFTFPLQVFLSGGTCSGKIEAVITDTIQIDHFNFLTPIATRTDVISTNAGVSQRLPWFGTSYSASWTTAHTNSNSFLNSYNPLVTSGLGVTLSVTGDDPTKR